MKILIIEDDRKIADFMAKGLKESGHVSMISGNGKDALEILLADETINLVILDLMLPGMDGLEVLSNIRKNSSTLPVLILSAKRSVHERVEGLQVGADDYLVKPFALSELLARVQVLFRRLKPEQDRATFLSHSGVYMNLLTREVKRDDSIIELQSKEFSLLEYFLRNPNRVLSKTLILEKIYHYNFDTQTNIVDVLVCRLRNKIDKEFSVKTIHTIRGVGYVFKVH